MPEPDLFLICPVCGTKIEIMYSKDQRRPTRLDYGCTLDTCPLCGATLIRAINPTFNDLWTLENEVKYTAAQRNKLLSMTKAYEESNSAKLQDLAKQEKEVQA